MDRAGAERRDPAKARRTSALVYRLRLLLYAYNGVAWPLVVPELFDNAVFWGLWIVLHAVWPHLAYAVSRCLADPLRSERMAIAVETAIIGFTVNEMGYLVWYAFSAVSAGLVSAAAFGGARTLVVSSFTCLAGTLAWGLLRGFHFVDAPPPPVELVGALGGAIPLLLIAQANFRVLKRLSGARRQAQERNRQYRSMMEMSAALRNAPDTETLIDQALDDFARLMPGPGLGLVLREPGRPGVVRHAAFRGVDETTAGEVIRALSELAAEPDGSPPGTLTARGEAFSVLPLRPHLRQLQGFLVISGPVGDAEQATMFGLFADQVASALESNLLTLRLERLANTDALTGLHNRAYFDRQLELAARNARGPAATPFSVVMIDLNGLKAVNDTYGHEAGDAMIRLAADMLNGAMRSSDILARFGGDEFVILASDCDARGVQELNRRIRAVVDDQQAATPVLDGERLQMRISLSVGMASSDEVDPAEIVETADRRMYEDKQRFYDAIRHRLGSADPEGVRRD